MLNKAIVNLNQIRQNALEIKKRLHNTKFCAIVKDNAYGHGDVEVANSLYNIVDCYAVSILEEAIRLRIAGIDKDILILIPCSFYELETAIRYDLTLTVCCLLDLRKIKYWTKKLQKKCKVHLKINTGMNRQGIDDLEEIKKIGVFCEQNTQIEIEGIYSHFAKPENKRLRKKQLNKFLLALNQVKVYNDRVISHISASGGFLKGEYLDMVRIGLLLYGYKPFKDDINVSPAMKIEVPMLKKVSLKAFDCALYGLKRTYKSRKFGLIRLGYGDGLNRNRQRCQIFNRCMDLSLENINNIYEDRYIIDDFDRLAHCYKTISYEIMTNITKRCEFIYLR